jgi:hypothetical protein
MDGLPVWLVSVSRRSPLTSRIRTVPTWSEEERQQTIALMRDVLAEAGDRGKERIFRMQVTMCLHRALSDAEIAGLPAWFHAAEAIDIAGGPVEILWENAVGKPSTRPCERPRKRLLDPGTGQLDLWIPLDCGLCAPCQARAAI